MSPRTMEPQLASTNADPVLDAIAHAIKPYLEQHPTARFDQYRLSGLTVRLRIIDQDFQGMELGDRHDLIDRYLDVLDDECADQLSFLALVAPDEITTSHINQEFEKPTWAAGDE